MREFISRMLDHSDFVPRRLCGAWTTWLIGLHNLSDALIWLAYLAIPLVLIYFVRRRRDLPFPGIFWLFGIFIASCGLTHLLEIVVFYVPVYRLAGVVKLATALASWTTVLALIPTVPRALALRSQEELEREVAEHRRGEAELSRARDVSDERVRERTAELEAIMEVVPAIIWIAQDADCRRIGGNRISYEFLGMEVGANTSLTAPPEERPRHFRALRDGVEMPPEELPMQRAARGDEVRGLELEIAFDDGSSHRLYGNATPLLDEWGRPCGAVSAFVDVTERLQAEAELRQSERRFRELADAMPQVVWTARPDGTIDYLNRRWYEFTGAAPDGAAARSWLPFLHPDDVQPSADRWSKALRSSEPYEIECRLLDRATGLYRWQLARAVPVPDESGRVARWFGTTTDIDDRKRTEEELRRSHDELERRVRERTVELEAVNRALREGERRSRAIFDQTFQLVALLGPDGTVMEANRTALEFVGLARDEVIGCPLWEIPGWPLDPELRRRLPGLAAEAARGGFVRFEADVRGADDRVATIDLSFKPMRDEAGRVVLLLAEGRDITERKHAEEKFRGLLESAPDAMVIVDEGGEIVLVNSQTEKIFGYDRAELLGQPVELLMPSRFDERHRRHRTGYTADPRVRPVGAGLELYGRRKDGSEFPVEVSLGPLATEEGMLVSSSIRDITERKRAEEMLQHQAELLDLVHDAIIVRELDGRIRYWNSGAAATYGWPAGDAVGRVIHDLLRTRFPRPIEELRAAVVCDGRWEGELFHSRRDGGEIVVESRWVAQLGGTRDEVEAVLEINRDITKRKRAEEERARQAEELARSNAELERFAFVASHDLQEPLRMVGSFAELLARRYRGRLDDKADQYIGFAVDGCARMQRLIEDLLEYSRVGTRGQPFVPVDCEAVLGRCLADLRAAIDESGAAVTHDPLPTIPADGTQLGQIFQNLIGNAIKFRSDRQLRIHISARCEAHGWIFCVADNGIGIDPRYTERVFVLFQRLHTRDEYPGTGIGLAICKKIVERHGGRIWLEPAPGGGTCFRFTIPGRETP